MTNVELVSIIKLYCEKANAAGNLSFGEALDLMGRCQNETNRVEDCVTWFCEARKDVIEGKKKKVFPHAKPITDKIYNAQVVKAYADAYAIALDAKEKDNSESYAEVHNAVADALVGYFDALYIDYLTECYGEDFIAAYDEYVDGQELEGKKAAAVKELRSAKQSLSRLKKGGNEDKIAEAEKKVAEATAKAKELGAI